jgi:hypothetical protein
MLCFTACLLKPLYEAIGEANNRNRRPASLGRMIERLMILDAVHVDKHHTWLGTEQDKLAYFKASLKDRFRMRSPQSHVWPWRSEDHPVLSRQAANRCRTRLRPRHVFLYLVTREVPAAFRMFVFGTPNC